MASFVEDILVTFSNGGIKRVMPSNGLITKHYAAVEDTSTVLTATALVGTCTCYFVGMHIRKAIMYVWDINSSEPIFRQSLPEKLNTLAFTNDSQIVIGASESGMLFLWQLSSGALVKAFKAHFSAITHTFITHDDAALLTASADGDAKAFLLADLCNSSNNAESPDAVRNWRGHTAPITCISGGFDGPFAPFCCFVTSSLDSNVMVWSWDSNKCCAKFILPDKVNCLAMDNSQTFIYSGCMDGNIYALSMVEAAKQNFDSSSVSVIRSHADPNATVFSGHRSGVRSCCVTFDSEMLISCANDGIRVWNIDGKVLIKHFTFPGEEPLSMLLLNTAVSRMPLLPFRGFQRTFTDSIDTAVIADESDFNDFIESSKSLVSNALEPNSVFKENDECTFVNYYSLFEENPAIIKCFDEQNELEAQKVQNNKLRELLNVLYMSREQ